MCHAKHDRQFGVEGADEQIGVRDRICQLGVVGS